MKKWLIPIAILALLVAGATTAAFALDGAEPSGDTPPIRSDEGIDPDECNLVHNIDACDQDDLDRLGGNGPMPITSGEQGAPSKQWPTRSDEGIDPDECNLVHNIDACDQDDLDRLGGNGLMPEGE